MTRSIATIVALALATIISGCAIKRGCMPHHPEAEAGWVSISGSAIPSATTPVDTTGKSLVNCLLDSRIVEILEYRKKSERETVSPAAGSPLPEQEVAALQSLLRNAEQLPQTDAVYTSVVNEVEALQLAYPQLLHGSGSALNYVFDPKVTTAYELARLEQQIRNIISDPERQAAMKAYQDLSESNGDTTLRRQGLDLLNQYVQRGLLKIEASQRARAWAYAKLAELEAATPSTAAGGGADSTMRGSKAEQIIQQLVADANRGLLAGGVTAGAAFSSTRPNEQILAIIELNDRGVVIVPLDSVFDSPLGGLWLFPGDRIKLMQLDQIGLLVGQDGLKQVGVNGLTAQRGVVQTEASKLKPLLYQVDELVDVRSNLVVVTYPAGQHSVKLMMPFSAAPPAAGSAMHRTSQLQRYIGLHNGAVVTLDHTDLSPLLKKSRRLMEKAASAQSQLCPNGDCSIKGVTAKGVTAKGVTAAVEKEGSVVNKPAQDVPILSDACRFVQQSSEDSRRLAASYWDTVVP